MSVHQPIKVRRAKLLRPGLASGLVARPRLLVLLDDGLDKPLTLVSGPAGCGKSTLIGQWLSGSDLPATWLSLDEHDGDLWSFVEHVVCAVQSLAPTIGKSTLGLLRMAEEPSAADLATEFGDELLTLDSDVIVVLDDYHTVDNSEVDEFLTTLLRFPPPRLRLVVASRVDPFLPLVGLRAHGMLAEVRSGDLRFTDEETRTLLREAINGEPDEETVQLIQTRTEGWITGVRLAALAFRDGGDLTMMAGAESSMQAFLADEMVSGQPADVQRFLLRSAVPERLCGDLCDTLIDATPAAGTGQAMLERLERAGLFVVPLGEDRSWYRYHHLFRELLLRRLVEQEGEEELRRLHARVSTWLADHDLIDDAIPHALASGDPTAAANLVSHHVQRALAERRWIVVEHWLNRLPPEQVLGRVELLLAQAWVQRIRGQDDAFASTVDRIEALLEKQAGTLDPVMEERWKAETLFIRQVFLSRVDLSPQSSLSAAMRAAELLPWSSHAAASTAVVYAGAIRQMMGDEDGAVGLLRQSLAECAGRSDPFSLHRAQCASLGLIGLWHNAGNLVRCRRMSEELLELSLAHELGWGAAIGHTYIGEVSYEWDRVDEAIEHYQAAIEEPEASSLIVNHAFLGLALAQQERGRWEDADATIERYLDRLFVTGASEALSPVRSFQARLAVMRGDLEPAIRWVRSSPVPLPGGAHDIEVPLLTRALVLVAEGSPNSLSEADAALETLLDYAKTVHSTRIRIAALAHKAVVQHAQGRRPVALTTFAEALALAEPRGYFRGLADLGPPMGRLLEDYEVHMGPSATVTQLLDSIRSRSGVGTLSPPSAVRTTAPGYEGPPIVERLTEREMDVLAGLARRLSNKEIAGELAVSPNTVKRHTASLYGKLGVSSRRQAVLRALTAGIIAPPDGRSPAHH